MHALPAIGPVNHLVDGNDIVIRTPPGAAMVSAADREAGVVVVYEADEISLDTGTGWTVVVTGSARLIYQTADAARYDSVLRPWVGGDMTQLI